MRLLTPARQGYVDEMGNWHSYNPPRAGMQGWGGFGALGCGGADCGCGCGMKGFGASDAESQGAVKAMALFGGVLLALALTPIAMR